MTVIRRLVESDWAKLREVRLRALADAPGNFFRTLAEEQEQPETHWRDMLTSQTGALFGLFAGDAIIGLTGAFTDRGDPNGQTAAFGMTWIDPAFRGRGLSRLYYRERVAWARAAGHLRICVGHRASNVASGRAMQAAGFRPVGRRVHRWPDGAIEDELLYELDLRD